MTDEAIMEKLLTLAKCERCKSAIIGEVYANHWSRHLLCTLCYGQDDRGDYYLIEQQKEILVSLGVYVAYYEESDGYMFFITDAFEILINGDKPTEASYKTAKVLNIIEMQHYLDNWPNKPAVSPSYMYVSSSSPKRPRSPSLDVDDDLYSRASPPYSPTK